MGRVNIVETELEFRSLTERPETHMLVVHHIGEIDRDVSAEEVHSWHLANGWAGIGYHYVIRKDGSIERGRPRTNIGSHAYGFNSQSIGINVVGDFMVGEPNEAQLDSLVNLLADLKDIYELEVNENTVLGHGDLMSTDCPGTNLASKMEDIRERERNA